MAYEYSIEVAQVGQIADASNRIIDSFTAEEVIGYGLSLKRGTVKDKQVLKWTGDIDTPMLGISVFTQTQYTGEYPVNSAVSVMTEGRVWVNAEDALVIASGQRAYLNVTNGLFTNVAANNLLIGKFLSGGTAAQNVLFVLELNPART